MSELRLLSTRGQSINSRHCWIKNSTRWGVWLGVLVFLLISSTPAQCAPAEDLREPGGKFSDIVWRHLPLDGPDAGKVAQYMEHLYKPVREYRSLLVEWEQIQRTDDVVKVLVFTDDCLAVLVPAWDRIRADPGVRGVSTKAGSACELYRIMLLRAMNRVMVSMKMLRSAIGTEYWYRALFAATRYFRISEIWFDEVEAKIMEGMQACGAS